MKTIRSTNPSRNFALVGEVLVTSEEDIIKIVQKARQAQKSWGDVELSKRISYLSKSYDIMNQKISDIAYLLSQEMGMPISQAIEEVKYGLGYFRWYLDNAHIFLEKEVVKETETEIHTIYYEPKGVVVAIAPWNFPTFLFVWSSIQALLAGNVVIFKTSKETILTGKYIEDIMHQSGLPDGVFQEVYGGGEIGDILTDQSIDFISFTGSTEIGQKLYKKAAEKMIGCTMELGGSAPGIVCEDADIDQNIESIYTMKFLNAGQVCDGLKRLIVHESRYDEVIEKLTKILATKKVGDALAYDTDIGPLVNERQLETLQSQYQESLEKGAKVLFAAEMDLSLKGAYFAPVLLGNITADMRVWREEVFGPILPVVKYKTFDEAIQLANDTQYGLGSYVFTESQETLHFFAKELKTGMIQHNNLNYCQPQNPFGGYKMSGIGRENGRWGFHEVCNIKVVSQEK